MGIGLGHHDQGGCARGGQYSRIISVMAMSRKERAASLFEEIVSSITSGDADLPAHLMKAFHACELAGWPEQQLWFKEELDGYPPGKDVPWYRQIKGEVTWQPVGNPPMSSLISLSGPEPPSEVTTDWRSGIALVLTSCPHGVRHAQGVRRERPGAFGNYIQEQTAYYWPAWFQNIRQVVESETLQVASRAAVALSYGDVVGGNLGRVPSGC